MTNKKSIKDFVQEFLGIRALNEEVLIDKERRKQENTKNSERILNETSKIFDDKIAGFRLELEESAKVKETDSIMVKNYLNEDLLKIDIWDESTIDKEKYGYIGKCARLTALCQNFPLANVMMENRKLTENAYKIIMPKDIVGNLMQYKDGTLGTPILADGRIRAHAGLEKINPTNFNPVMIFTAMSMVTGQYFMARIDDSLKSISEDVKDIIGILMTDKEAEILSIKNFIENIEKNYESIIENENLKNATLVNIQGNIMTLDKNAIFYEKIILEKLKSMESITNDYSRTSTYMNRYTSRMTEIEKLIGQQHICLELLALSKVYELRLAEIYNSKYIDNMIEAFEEIEKKKKLLESNTTNKYSKVLDTIFDKAWINYDLVTTAQGKVGLNYQKRIKSFSKNLDCIVENIDLLKTMNQKDNEFIILNEDVYYLK